MSSSHAVVFVHDVHSSHPRLVVRSGRRGRGQVVADVVLPARSGLYRLGFVDALLVQLRSAAAVSFDGSFDAWYAQLVAA